LHAHLLATCLEQNFRLPALGLLVSGGHTHLYHIQDFKNFRQIGKTLDDAAGEAFDKVGKMLGLPYPCGRIIDSLAVAGTADPRLFPRPYLHNENLDFSFSGLKTAALCCLDKYPELQKSARSLKNAVEASDILKNFCASFNLAVVDTLCVKTHRALDAYPEIRTLLFAGGVASNTLLRERMAELMRRRGGRAFSPSPALCTDNAAMIAHAGWLYAKEGFCHTLHMETIPRGKPVPDDMIGNKQCRAA
jgi:N6-L-threonylcarbamoyladenine synthase